MQPDITVVPLLEKLEATRKSKTEALCTTLLKAMTESAKSSTIPPIRFGPELPDFHKLSADIDITCYLSTFERMVVAKKKPKEDWPRLLEPYLTGKAQQAFHSLTESDKKDFDKITAVILRRYQLTPEAYRLKFKSSSKKHDETFEEFCCTSSSVFPEVGSSVSRIQSISRCPKNNRSRADRPVSVNPDG